MWSNSRQLFIIVDMDKSIKQIEQELHLLEQKKNEIENALVEVVSSAMLKIAQNKPIQRINKHCLFIRFSDTIDNPWNPEFYDWEKSVDIVLKYLKSKPPIEWVCKLEEKLENTSRNQPVVFEYRKQNDGVIFSEKIPVPRIFIEQILKELNDQ